MTDSPSETTELDAFAGEFAAKIGAERWTADHGTVHVYVDREHWLTAAIAARDEGELDFFSWLSAVDWSREVAVGEPAEDVDNLEERYEVLCRLSSSTNSDAVILATVLDKEEARLDSLTPVYAGAAWHERETAEMFGIDFPGHPNLINLYLPEAFEGHPLRKSFALGAREVKPWPGHVDVEDMPSTENIEAGEGS
ncbi:MAG: NADH-quinone oxidoreductase subunit C [Acidimicrobiia bacterium]|nr:NADH-quinone oxidoreductase subunit C [Acidimicrobiia bacterium]